MGQIPRYGLRRRATSEIREVHEVVRLAQQAGVDPSARPNVARTFDRAARRVITDAG
jgi:Xaa-Pro aminopeptidase